MTDIERGLRRQLTGALALMAITAAAGCRPVMEPDPVPPVQLSEAQRARIKRFAGVTGFELTLDAVEHFKALFNNDQGASMGTGNFKPDANLKYSRSFGPTGPLEFVDVSVYEPDAEGDWSHPDGKLRYKGTLLGHYRVPVADRIPDELLDDLRKNGGGLRIKIRLHREGVLLGWDVQRFLNPWKYSKKEIRRRNILLPSEQTSVGGDFREAEIINGVAVRKGWYIHPRTGERIETDF